MTYDLSRLPAVRAQLERDVAAASQESVPADESELGGRAAATVPAEYARAPAASGQQPAGARPPAIQGGVR